MKELIPYFIIGLITGFLLKFTSFGIENWEWWLLMLPMNMTGIYIYDNYIKK